jgi:orotate phosphoribosyltransferase
MISNLSELVDQCCRLHGDFVLSSGKRSNIYFDKYLLLTYPVLVRHIVQSMAEKVSPLCTMFLSMTMGAVPFATLLSQRCRLPLGILRKEQKAYGTCKLIEGQSIKNQNIVIVEDVLTTGTQVINAVKLTRQEGAIVVGVIAVIARGDVALDALFKLGIEVFPVLQFDVGDK